MRPITNLGLLHGAISDHVFNRMPIRLLKYSEASELELVDRTKVWELITDAMRNVTEEQVLELVIKHQRDELKKNMDDLKAKLAAIHSPFSNSEGPELRRKIEEVQRDMNSLDRGSQLPLGWYGTQALKNGRKGAFAELSERYAGFAILSHTWLLPSTNETEVMYDDRLDETTWKEIRDANGQGYQKLFHFCETAEKEYNISFFWMDTVCIDKKNTSELSESIRSMYRWYSESSLCIAYLGNTTSLQDLAADPWFVRGWTLQELLAPKRVKFYTKDWKPLTHHHNDKSMEAERCCQILTTISRPTGISPGALLSFEPGIKGGVASKMVWAATRKTTRGEDHAYSLMGIFAVSISSAYGEGAERAFFRLVEAILTCFRNALDILNCGGKPISNTIHSSRVLPSSPECYLGHDPDLMLFHIIPPKPLLLTHTGLKVSLLCVEAEIMAPGWGRTEWGTFDGGVNFQCKLPHGSPLRSSQFGTLWLRGNHPVMPDQLTSNKFVLGIWSFTVQSDHRLSIPPKCAAFLLQVNHFGNSPQTSPHVQFTSLSSSHIGSQSKVNTKRPVTFSMGTGGIFSCDELERHGMKLLTVYL
ncbi:hypothetical protein BJ912DRAFT_479867 [Pholiota molesta]|nr:hypothetical protein BJ912DRAFT_479867 [Pholiota molesta]